MKNVPIKFRGVDIETGEVVFGRDFMQYSDTDVWIGDNDLPKNYPVKDVTLLVGYDADGNEVYEGDELYYYRCFCVSGDYIRQNKIPPAGVCTVISAHRLDGLYDVGLNDHFDYEFLLKKF